MSTSRVSTRLSSLKINSPAKLNLFLDILRKRPDGYHDIETLFERISLSDTLKLSILPSDEIIVTSNTKDIPVDKDNLVFKAADLLKRHFKIKLGVKIDIEKKIPIGAGLGGGSSNAASVLLGLNKLFKLRLSKKRLISLANELGSDVAFFVMDKRFAVGKAKGGDLKAVKVPSSLVLWHILFALPIKVFTKDVYQAWDYEVLGGKSFRLTKKHSNVNMLLSLLSKNKQNLLNQKIYNRLSETVMKSYSFVSELRDDLLKSGLKYVHMSGSGPTLFSTFTRKAEAVKAYNKLKSRFVDRCRVLLAHTQ